MSHIDIEGVEYEVVVTTGDNGGGYDWTAANLLRDPQGRLYFVEDSGCSCSYNLESVYRSDLIPVESWQQAAARVSQSNSIYSVQREDFRADCREAEREGRL